MIFTSLALRADLLRASFGALSIRVSGLLSICVHGNNEICGYIRGGLLVLYRPSSPALPYGLEHNKVVEPSGQVLFLASLCLLVVTNTMS